MSFLHERPIWSLNSVFHGIIDGHSLFVIRRLSLGRALNKNHSLNGPEKLEKNIIGMVMLSLDMIKKFYLLFD